MRYKRTEKEKKEPKQWECKGNIKVNSTRIGMLSIIYKNKIYLVTKMKRNQLDNEVVRERSCSRLLVFLFRFKWAPPSILFICFHFLFISFFVLFDLMAYACMCSVCAIISCWFSHSEREIFFSGGFDRRVRWHVTEDGDETHFYSVFIETENLLNDKSGDKLWILLPLKL